MELWLRYLVQATHIPNAPTGQRYAGSAPRFPYIEAENARINFKLGNEKKPLSFLNSDLSISLAPGDAWELHFRAQPVRTDLDLDLADTGVLRIDGTLHRAALLGQMPLDLKVRWSGVPLGQLSRLTLGRDIGWRGGLEVDAQVEGTADQAQINTTLKVAGLHRSEFSRAHPLDVATACRASFRKESRSLEDISCASPVGDGALRLTGSVQEVQTQPQANLTLEIQRVPATAVLSGLQELRSGLGGGVQAAGALNGFFNYTTQSGRPPLIAGEVALDSLRLTPPDAGKPFVFAPVRVKCDSPEAGNTGSLALLLQPVRVAMGAPAPVTVDGRFTPAGFNLHLSGSSTLARLLALNRAVGLLGSARVALGGAGTAALDLDLRGRWLLPRAGLRESHRLIDCGGQHCHSQCRTYQLVFVSAAADCFRPGNPEPDPGCLDQCSHQLRQAGGTRNVGVPHALHFDHALRGAFLAHLRGTGLRCAAIHATGHEPGW